MQGPGSESRIIYIDGAFDLFHAGHVEVHSHLLFFFNSNEKKIFSIFLLIYFYSSFVYTDITGCSGPGRFLTSWHI